MHIQLTVAAGPHQGQSFTFTGHDVFLVGRSRRAHFRLPEGDDFFSRIHFLIEFNPPHCWLLDMGSKNGTRVNGKNVAFADLQDGDQIQAGTTVLRVSVAAGEAQASAAPAVPRGHTVAAPPLPSSPAAPPTRLPDGSRVVAPPLPGPAAGACPACGARTRTGLLCTLCEAQESLQAQPIPGYRIVRELGKGGMGVVYLAVRATDGVAVALKTILPGVAVTDTLVARFLREANILRELTHPHIVRFQDMGEAAGRLYFAMDYVRGTDAAHLLRDNGPLPVGRALALVGPMLEALAHAHARGFVHRDVKPSNLLVAAQAGGDLVQLADFGLARVYQESPLSGLTLRGDRGGTVPFMAPEQITHFRESQPGVDQYAAAATLYNLLTGHYVYNLPRRSNKQVLMILEEDPIPIRSRRADLPVELAAVIHRGLARDPGARFPDVEALRRALLACLPTTGPA